MAGFLYEGVRPANDTGTLGGFLTTLALGILSVAVCVALGFYIGTRRALLASWRERAETAEREQASRVAEARANERARIAREMHDVLAHRISLVAMHSGALAYRTDLSRQETSQAAEVIRDNAHLALTELREVLGVLRLDNAPDDPADAAVERPQPTLADLAELLEEARSAGARLTATVDLVASRECRSRCPAMHFASSRNWSPTPASTPRRSRWRCASSAARATASRSRPVTAWLLQVRAVVCLARGWGSPGSPNGPSSVVAR
nr:histidine kinase dimerization/phosphoacceptor domain-containing protein [Knoellia sp. DB2414S]